MFWVVVRGTWGDGSPQIVVQWRSSRPCEGRPKRQQTKNFFHAREDWRHGADNELIAQAVLIDKLSGDQTMNGKSEWTFVKLNKLSTTN